MIRQALHAAVAAAVVLLVLRTFIALGVVVPLQVDGASMAPGLLGRHIEYNCPRCVQRLQIDATQPPRPGSLTCPACEAQVRLDCGRPVHGDRIAVDRLMLAGPPGRWDRVVLRRPDDARRLAVKRVIGLPGERIVLHAGDLLVNGQVVQKGLADQRRTRILMHRESDNARRWRAESAGWRPTAGGGWSADCGPAAANGYPTLRYAPPGRSEPTDDLPYNAGVTRRLNAVTDVMLTAAVTASPDAELCLRVVSGRGAVYCRIDGPRRRVELTVNG
ncbi:MAG: S26 family signal peptidase, partial [Planctomycetota bacterium]